MFVGMRVMWPSRKEISSMLFIFTLKELNWTAMRKYWRLNCTTTGLLHILNLVRWWELKNAFFLLFWSYCAVCRSFLKNMIILNACPEKYTSHLGLSSIQRSNLVLQISMRITSFSQNYCNGVVVGLLHVWLIRDIYFDNRKSSRFTKGCRSSHWVKSNFP